MQNKALTVIKHVVWGIFLAIFVFIAIVAVWVSVDKFILKSPVPSMFGYSSLTVKTGSMAGTIEIGDMIIIKDKDEYKIGDIVTYLHEGDTIPTTHRIIGKNSDGSFITKGDSNNAKDPEPVSEDIILGEVIKVIPDVGVFAAWVQSEGWIYIVAVLAIVGLGLFILSSGDDEDTDKKEENAEEKKDGEDTDGAESAEESAAEEKDSDTSEENTSEGSATDETTGEASEATANSEATVEGKVSKGFFSKLKFKSKTEDTVEAVKNLETTTEEVTASVEELTTAISIMTAAVTQMTAVVTEMSALRQQREALAQAQNQEQTPITTESTSSNEVSERDTSANSDGAYSADEATDGGNSEETTADGGSREPIVNEENISSENDDTAKV